MIHPILIGCFAVIDIGAAEDGRLTAVLGQDLRRFSYDGVHQCRAYHRGSGAHARLHPWNVTNRVARRTAVVDHQVGQVHQLISLGMPGSYAAAMCYAGQGDDENAHFSGFFRHFNRHGVTARIRVDDQTIFCRDLARRFNHYYGEVFRIPQAKVLEASAKVPGVDGEKMSKSYDNTIEIFEEPAAVRKKVMCIKTDSRPMEQPKDPETDHLFQLYSLFVDQARSDEMAALYRRGGFGYGAVKKELAAVAEQFFSTARFRRQELEGDPERVRQILADGATRARRKASQVLRRAQQACGIPAR